jgi:hypothetical protein
MDINAFLKYVKDTVNPKTVSPLPEGYQAPTPSPTPTPDRYKNAIKEGLKNWGVEPTEEVLGAYVQAIQSNPIYQKMPFLLPAISIAETGGGQKMKQPNNSLNWGINLPKGYFDPTSQMEVIGKAASGIAGRTKDYTERQGLEKFRKTGELKYLADWYAPTEDNPDTGGDTYAKNLRLIMDVFDKKLTL